MLLTGAPSDGDDLGPSLAKALRPHGFAGPGFVSHTAAERARDLEGTPLPARSRVFALCAIARPGPFFGTVRDQGLEIVDDLTFPDHHRYPDTTLRAIEGAFDASGAEYVVTTSKDRVKLQGRLQRPLAEIPIRARPEADFFRWLDTRLDEIPGLGNA